MGAVANSNLLATMHDLHHIPTDKLQPRMAKLVAEKQPVPPPTVAMQNLAKLEAAGVTIVMGTDAGNIGTLHGPSVFREMALMRDAGLTPLQVLRSATTNGAKAMGRDDLGAIAPGKLADLVLLDADPLADVANLSHAVHVVKGGVVYDLEGADRPHSLVDRDARTRTTAWPPPALATRSELRPP
jgi:imidazolonepropionase-like amidohydrolase